MTPTIPTFNTKALYEYIQKQSDNRQLVKFIEIGATFLLISFFLLFAVRPTVLVISTLVGEIKAKEISSLQMKNKIDKVIQAEDTFSQIQEKYALVEAALPSRPDYSSIAGYFNGSIQQSQLETSPVNFNLKSEDTDKSEQKNITSYGLSSPVKGDFLSAMSFINKLLHGRRVVDIKSVSLSSRQPNKSDQEIVQNGTINIGVIPVIYYWQNLDK